MESTDAFKTRFIETAHALKGSARRLLMACTVQERMQIEKIKHILPSASPVFHGTEDERQDGSQQGEIARSDSAPRASQLPVIRKNSILASQEQSRLN